MEKLVVLALLVIYSISDIRYKEITAWQLYFGIAVVFVMKAVSSTDTLKCVILSAVIYGIICVIADIMQNWIGKADFDVMYLIYLTLGFENMYMYLVILLAVSGILYILLNGSDRNRRLPLIPVLTVGYFVNVIFCEVVSVG